MWPEEDVDGNREDRQRAERGPVLNCLTSQHRRELLEVSTGVLLGRLFS